MSFNLKNRPRKEEQKLFVKGYGKIKASPIFKFDEDEVEKWFEGFEKKQRQNWADYEKALATSKNWDKEFLACWKAISNYIKLEVLGVEPKIEEETKR